MTRRNSSQKSRVAAAAAAAAAAKLSNEDVASVANTATHAVVDTADSATSSATKTGKFDIVGAASAAGTDVIETDPKLSTAAIIAAIDRSFPSTAIKSCSKLSDTVVEDAAKVFGVEINKSIGIITEAADKKDKKTIAAIIKAATDKFAAIIESDLSLASDMANDEEQYPDLREFRRKLAALAVEKGGAHSYGTATLNKDLIKQQRQTLIAMAQEHSQMIMSLIPPSFPSRMALMMISVLFGLHATVVKAGDVLPENKKPLDKAAADTILSLADAKVSEMPLVSKYKVNLIGLFGAPFFHGELRKVLMILLGGTHQERHNSMTGCQSFIELMCKPLVDNCSAYEELKGFIRDLPKPDAEPATEPTATVGTKRRADDVQDIHPAAATSATSATANDDRLKEVNRNIHALKGVFIRVAALALVSTLGLSVDLKLFDEAERGDVKSSAAQIERMYTSANFSWTGWWDKVIGNRTKCSGELRLGILNPIAATIQGNISAHINPAKLFDSLQKDVVCAAKVITVLSTSADYSERDVSAAVNRVWKSKRLLDTITAAGGNQPNLMSAIMDAFKVVEHIIGPSLFLTVCQFDANNVDTTVKADDTVLLARCRMLHFRGTVILGTSKANDTTLDVDSVIELMDTDTTDYDGVESLYSMRPQFGATALRRMWPHHPLLPRSFQNITSQSIATRGLVHEASHEAKQEAKFASKKTVAAENQQDVAKEKHDEANDLVSTRESLCAVQTATKDAKDGRSQVPILVAAKQDVDRNMKQKNTGKTAAEREPAESKSALASNAKLRAVDDPEFLAMVSARLKSNSK